MGKKKEKEYGKIETLQKAMTFSLSSNMGRYCVSIANISSDLLILLADPRNKLRLLNALYFLYAVYEKIGIKFFTGDRQNYEDYTTYTFFINSLSKTKICLTLIDGEELEYFVTGEELTKEERKGLEESDMDDLNSGIERLLFNKRRSKYGVFPKIRWNKAKYKEENKKD